MIMNDIAITVDHVSKSFRLPHEKNSSIKSAALNFYKKNRSYEKQQVLNDVSFEIKHGEFFGIVGRNGSGKSTLLKLLAGIYSPDKDKGTVTVNGKLTPFIELGVGFNPELTGRENVYLNGALLGFNRKEMGKMYNDIVRFAELGRFMDQKLKNYSSGMQVRLAFSIAIRARSDILLLDEVLAVGDAAFQQKCYDYFEELKRQKKTVVFVSHDMSAVRRFCTSAVYIKEGNLIQVGSPADIADIYAEENIDNLPSQGDPHANRVLSDSHSLDARIVAQTKDSLDMELRYESKSKEPVYIGMSLLKDGSSVAEIITDQDKKLTGKGTATYTLDTNILNPNTYTLTAGLFTFKNRRLVAIAPNKCQFVLKGDDPTKGGALKLANAWSYNKNHATD